jgi:hypothetical protein
LSRIHLTSGPLLPMLRCSVCEVPTKMLHDKVNKVRQSPPHCSCRNTRSLRYLAHSREWLFIKHCPNCLINNVRTPDFGFASLSGAQNSPWNIL